MRLAQQKLLALPVSAVVLGVVCGVFLVACTPYTQRRAAAIYDPAESLTEIVAVLRRHIPDDTYRFPPGRDFTGRNVYRASLLRLENIERIYRDEMRSGYMDAVIEFSKARSLERLRGFDLAAHLYREAARKDHKMRDEALRSARICEAIYAADQLGIDLQDPVANKVVPFSLAIKEVSQRLDQRVAELGRILAGLEASQRPHSHYRAVIRQEIERADLTRSHYFLALRHVIPDGTIRAVAELQKLLTRHSASKNRRRHMLELADLYAAIARETVLAVPPEGLKFDPPKFQELVDAASDLYRAVATQDGTSEKIEASRSLEAFLAFTLRVDRDRFAQ